MNVLSCFIVEDDPQALDYISSIIIKYGNIQIIGSSPSIHKAATLIKKSNPDFIMLDVYLEDGTAFDFLKLFDKINFKIIFSTSYAKHAIEAFKFSALDYLLKPYEPQELITALDKVQKSFTSTNYQSQLETLLHNFSTKKEAKKIVLKNSDAIFVVLIKDILYAKSDNNYTTFYLIDSRKIVVSKPLKSFEEKLTPFLFFRSHQRYLLNTVHISSYNKRTEEITLNNKEIIPVAQSKKQQLLHIISKQY